MKKIGQGLNELMASLGVGDEGSAKARRAALVNVMWRNAVEAVYKEASSMVLDHINAVYIMRAVDIDDARVADRVTDGGTVLVVYSDDSLIRSDLDARQEFLKMKINEQGERVEAFCIKPSRFDMKARHPFSRQGESRNTAKVRSLSTSRKIHPLTVEQIDELEARVSVVEDPTVRKALIKAMTADMQRKTD